MAHAVLAARRSTCPAAAVGAVIARDDVVVAIGYNGAPRGVAHCSDDGCVVIAGGETGRDYSRHVHAEANAIVHCARDGRSSDGCDLYVTRFPCLDCAKLIIQAGIRRVFVLDEDEGEDWLVSGREMASPVAMFLIRAGVRIGLIGATVAREALTVRP